MLVSVIFVKGVTEVNLYSNSMTVFLYDISEGSVTFLIVSSVPARLFS